MKGAAPPSGAGRDKHGGSAPGPYGESPGSRLPTVGARPRRYGDGHRAVSWPLSGLRGTSGTDGCRTNEQHTEPRPAGHRPAGPRLTGDRPAQTRHAGIQSVNDGRDIRDMREEREERDAFGARDERGVHGVRDARAARDGQGTEGTRGNVRGPGGAAGSGGGPGRRGPVTGGPGGGGFGDDGHGPDGPWERDQFGDDDESGAQDGRRGTDARSASGARVPAARSGSARDAFGGPRSYTGPGPDDDQDMPDDLGADEQALSRLLKQVVQEVEPRQGSLDHLRHAVPARRARKRHALIGVAAAALLLGTAIPAVIHVSHAGGSGADRTSVAGHGEQAHGGTGQGKGTDGGRQGMGEPYGTGGPGGKGGQHGTGDGTDRQSGAPSGPDPGRTLAATSPACVATALGDIQASVGQPDEEGKVYGSFRVTNVSASDCTVDGAGTVVTVAQGAADPSKINVVDHTEGDPASGLPSPAQEPAQLILQPGMAYEVKFAWVPSGSCQADGGDGGASPGPTPSEGSDSAGQSDVTPQLAHEDGEPVSGSGSVAVSHTAEPGAPTAATTIPNACAGTLYRTGLLPGA